VSTQHTLGVLSPFLGSWYYGGILDSIARSAARADANVIAVQTLDAGTGSIEVGEPPDPGYPLGWQHAEGFIVVVDAVSVRYLGALKAAGKPMVTISQEYAELDLPVILPDNWAGAREAVTHLLRHGHRRIAFVGCMHCADVRERRDAYWETLAAHGIDPDPSLVFGIEDNQQSGGERAAAAMIAAGLPSTAVVAGTDANAVGVMRGLGAAGLRLPADQAVIGFDDLQEGAFTQPRLSSVRQHVQAIGSTAVTALLEQLDHPGREVSRRHLLPTSLVVRQSCGCVGDGTARPDADGPTATDRLANRVRAIISAGGTAPDSAAEGGAVDLSPSVDALVRYVRAEPPPIPPPTPPQAGRDQLPIPTVHPETMIEIAHALADFVRDPDSADLPRPVLHRVQSAILDLMQAQGRAQFADVRHLQSTLGSQYEVGLDLLRGHEKNPRSLDWLSRTDVLAGCLALWADGARPDDPEPRLDVVGTYRRGVGEQDAAPTTMSLDDFPPPELLAAARQQPGTLVLILPVKFNDSDWGLLAVVDEVEANVPTGREPINQWAALLAVALDRQSVLAALHLQEERLRTAALYDDLTGLPNRTLFLDRLRQTIQRGRRQSEHGYGVLFLDLDGFKVINDSLGHAAGDRLLIQVAERIRGSLRDSDTAARFGGDEFLILLDPVDSEFAPAGVADRLHAALSRPFHVGGQEVVITASVGIAIGGDHYSDAEDVLRDADLAMYSAKSHRKGSHAIFNVRMHASAVSRLRIETDLRRALDRHEFELHYQPLVDLATGRFDAVEALIRWREPTGRLVPPGEFLPVAEETGLILPLSQWIIGECGRQLAAWDDDGRARGLAVSINVSNRQFWQGKLIDDVDAMLHRTGVAPRRIALEITEGVVMHDVDVARKLLQDLHGLGCELHIDDFGTGYSSLEALHQLPIDALKVDRSFVARLQADPRSGELVRTIVLMAGNLGLDLIAEGIETAAQRWRLVELGCRRGQGELFSGPLPPEGVAALAASLGSGTGGPPRS
jgi:diguanylate cyclase (GGDEF)-like protein